jgi:hypothetical protein
MDEEAFTFGSRTNQNRQAEANHILEPVYDQFTEGFEAADLKQSKAFWSNWPWPINRAGIQLLPVSRWSARLREREPIDLYRVAKMRAFCINRRS